MICPRFKSKSYVNFYGNETKCIACGHSGYQIPDEVLAEVAERTGEMGKGTQYIRKNAKKYYI